MFRRGTPLSRLKLRPKIAVAVGSVLLLSTTILAGVAVSEVTQLGRYLESSYNDTFIPYQQAEALNDALERAQVAVLTGLDTPSNWPATQAVIDRERTLVAAGVRRYATELTLKAQPEMRVVLKRYGVLDRHVTREVTAVGVLTADMPRLNGAVDTISREMAAGDDAAARMTYEREAAPVFARTVAATSVLMAMQPEESAYAAQAGLAVMQRTEQSIVLTVALTLLLALVTIFWLTRQITSPLQALVAGTQAVQRGDLSQPVAVTTQDEIGVLAIAFNQMIAALRAERDRSQRYLDTAAVFLLALDKHARITMVNRYACSTLGWTADELQGRNWIETCLPPRMKDLLGRQFANLVAGDLTTIENPVLTKSGEERLIEWRNTVLHDDAGQVIGTLSSGTDITDRRTEQLRVLRMTMRTVQDIVSNALMSLYAFRIEAEPHVTPQALALFDHIVADTALRLETIGNLQTVAEKRMAAGVGIDYAKPET